MMTYIITTKKELLPTKRNLQRLEAVSDVKLLIHKGKVGHIKQLFTDTDEKIIAISPQVTDWKLDVESVVKIKNVKAVLPQSTSFNWVYPDTLKKSGIAVANVPGFSVDSVAEYAMCLAIESARRLPMHLKNNLQVDWPTPPMLLRGKTIGIVGLGRIGTRIGEISSGIGMHVIYWSRNTRDKRFTYVSLNKLFQTADVIIPAVAVNNDTKKLFTHKLVNTLKSSAIIVGINVVKNLLDSEYIIKRVEQNKIGGYVFEGEGPVDFKKYKGNVWYVPAIAWYTQDALNNLEQIWVDNMIAFAKGKPQNIVAQ